MSEAVPPFQSDQCLVVIGPNEQGHTIHDRILAIRRDWKASHDAHAVVERFHKPFNRSGIRNYVPRKRDKEIPVIGRENDVESGRLPSPSGLDNNLKPAIIPESAQALNGRVRATARDYNDLVDDRFLKDGRDHGRDVLLLVMDADTDADGQEDRLAPGERSPF